MGDTGRAILREPEVGTPEQYTRRVHRLATIYVALFAGSLAGFALIVWKAQFLVSLTQRSNVETLTLAFFLVFFGYVVFLSTTGVAGAFRIAAYAMMAKFSADRKVIERYKMESLKPANGPKTAVALSLVLEQENMPGAPFELPIADDAGSLGTLRVDGARVTHAATYDKSSSSLLAFFAEQVKDLLGKRGIESVPEIVLWRSINDEETEQYLSLVRFACNLEKHLGSGELWPKVTITKSECSEIERRLSAICSALRDEAFLPDWEYSANHKLPLIPEPLGLASLTRSEHRADPVASMGVAVAVVFIALVALALLIVFPPWIAGS